MMNTGTTSDHDPGTIVKADIVVNGLSDTQTCTNSPYQDTKDNASDPDNKRSKCRQLESSYGVILAASGALSYSWGIVVTNYLKEYDYYAMGMYRSVCLMLPSLMYIAWYQLNMFPPGKVKLLVFRAVAGTVGSFICFVALQNLPVSESSTLLQMTPVFVSLIGVVFMKESCSAFTTIIILLTVGGIVLVANPIKLTSDLEGVTVSNQLLGIFCALTTNVIYATIIIAIRNMRSVSPAIILSYLGIMTSLVAIVGCIINNELKIPTNVTEFGLMVSAGLSYLLGQVCISLSLRYETSVVVSMVQVSQVLFCSLLQIFLLRQPIGLIEGIGVAVIAVNVLSLGFQRYISGLPQDSTLKKRFQFLLR